MVPATLQAELWNHFTKVARGLAGFRHEELRTTTLYLDTPDLAINRGDWDQAIPAGSRKQVRLRQYGDGKDSSTFFEFKWNADNISHKRRQPIQREAIQSLSGIVFNPQDPVLTPIWRQVALGIIQPRLAVRYYRLALESAKQRYTLDTQIEYWNPADRKSLIEAGFGVLELKIADGAQAAPGIDELIADFFNQLGPSISKCADGLQRLYSSIVTRSSASSDSKTQP